MKVISDDTQVYLEEAVEALLSARAPIALTGAGISVGSGIPDFRSPGGLWSIYAPDEYATLDVFYQNPAKAWELYRALGRVLQGKTANQAHFVLAELEHNGLLEGIITQNVDALHQKAGSKTVFEVHGDHQNLQCLECCHHEPVSAEHFEKASVPLCPRCRFPLKPNVVLFGEPVRDFDKIEMFLSACDLLLVIGTSAQIFPAAGIPGRVRQQGGIIFEFNHEAALAIDRLTGMSKITDYFFHGDLLQMLPLLKSAVATRIKNES